MVSVSVVVVVTTCVVSGAEGVTTVVVSDVSVELESLLQATNVPAMAKIAMNFFINVCFLFLLKSFISGGPA
jgi:hypothetical protein